MYKIYEKKEYSANEMDIEMWDVFANNVEVFKIGASVETSLRLTSACEYLAKTLSNKQRGKEADRVFKL